MELGFLELIWRVLRRHSNGHDGINFRNYHDNHNHHKQHGYCNNCFPSMSNSYTRSLYQSDSRLPTTGTAPDNQPCLRGRVLQWWINSMLSKSLQFYGMLIPTPTVQPQSEVNKNQMSCPPIFLDYSPLRWCNLPLFW